MGQPEGSKLIEDNATATHAMLVNGTGEVVGVCRMHLSAPQEAQVLFMGIRKDMQGKKLVDLLVQYMKQHAQEKGAPRMMLHVRENNVNFYCRNGYEIEEEH